MAVLGHHVAQGLPDGARGPGQLVPRAASVRRGDATHLPIRKHAVGDDRALCTAGRLSLGDGFVRLVCFEPISEAPSGDSASTSHSTARQGRADRSSPLRQRGSGEHSSDQGSCSFTNPFSLCLLDELPSGPKPGPGLCSVYSKSTRSPSPLPSCTNWYGSEGASGSATTGPIKRRSGGPCRTFGTWD